MPTPLSTILSEMKKLSNDELNDLYKVVEETIVNISSISSLTDNVKEHKFSKGILCPHCNSNKVVRNGSHKGKQRYMCKDCHKSFGDFTKSIVSNSKKPYDKWLHYIKCMIKGYSLRKTASEVGITLTTAFYWRHKVLDAIRTAIGKGKLSGIVEADETFFLESFKGNHKKNKLFIMPREPRKRGEASNFRGISHEQVCVACAVDRNGNIINELACNGRITHKDLGNVYRGAIDKEAVVCTDKHKSYVQFAKDFRLDLIQLKSGKTKQGIYHIQHINSYHNELKKFMKRFNGVSTKHLVNYLYWFKWLKQMKDSKDYIKAREMLVKSMATLISVDVRSISNRKALFA